MKRLFLILPLIISFILISSCGESREDKARFFQTYKEILVAREMNPDSASANKEAAKILAKNGFTKSRFREMFISLSKDRDEFVRVIDSLRQWATNEAAKHKPADDER